MRANCLLAHIPPYGPKNVILLPQMGVNTWVRSWIPDEEIVGMAIRHGESYGLSKLLTVWEGEKAVYRPTVHYAYMPSHDTFPLFANCVAGIMSFNPGSGS